MTDHKLLIAGMLPFLLDPALGQSVRRVQPAQKSYSPNRAARRAKNRAARRARHKNRGH